MAVAPMSIRIPDSLRERIAKIDRRPMAGVVVDLAEAGLILREAAIIASGGAYPVGIDQAGQAAFRAELARLVLPVLSLLGDPPVGTSGVLGADEPRSEERRSGAVARELRDMGAEFL